MGLMATMLGNLGQGLFVALAFLVVLTIIVVGHELGHFWVARWCGVKVAAFSVGIGPELLHFIDKHGTRWRVAAYPIGGYVRFVDDADEASSPSDAALKSLNDEDRKGAFQLKALWQRVLVILAGPVANFLLAIAIFSSLTWWSGIRTMPAIIDEVVANTPAFAAGFKQGDRITSLDGEAIGSFDDALRIIMTSGGRKLQAEVERSGARVALEVTPQSMVDKDPIVGKFSRGRIGIKPFVPPFVGQLKPESIAALAGFKSGDKLLAINGASVRSFNDALAIVQQNSGHDLAIAVEREGRTLTMHATPAATDVDDPMVPGGRLKVGSIGVTPSAEHMFNVQQTGIAGSLVHGTVEMWTLVKQNAQAIRDLVLQRQSTEQLGGPVRIAAFAGEAAKLGPETLLRFIALLSVGVGVFNLLPILPLDGGRLLFYAVEGVLRRPVDERVQVLLMNIGLALILSLTVFVMFNDRFIVLGWLGGKS